MLILSRVCAEFRDRTGAVIHRVTPETRLSFREAPDAIREDPLFRMLVEEGSLEASVTPLRRKELEADPLAETDAAGRKEPATRPKALGRKRSTRTVQPDDPAGGSPDKTIDEP